MGQSLEKQLTDIRVLIVEDHDFQRRMLEQSLRNLGVSRLLTARNGAEALKVLRTPGVQVDVLITDMMMPDVDGIELIPQLLAAAGNAAIVLASGDAAILATAEAIAQAHGLRVLGALAKPLTPDKLRPLLEGYLAGRGGPA